MTVGPNARPLTVHLCPVCTRRLGATDLDGPALELFALTLVHRQIQHRIGSLIDGLREILPLLSCAETTEPRRGRD